MGNVKFYLKEPTGDKDTLIYLKYHYSGEKPFVYSIRDTCHPKDWNKHQQRAVFRGKRSDLALLNQTLDEVKNYLIQARRDLLIENKPITNDLLKDRLDELLGRRTIDRNKELLPYFSEYINNRKATGYKDHKSLNTTYLMLKSFNPKIQYENINLVFYRLFLKYMTHQGYSKNYIGKQFSNIKQVVNEAAEEGLHKNFEFRSGKFKRQSEEVYNVYNTVEELRRMHQHDFSDNKRLEQVRDRYLLMCFVGMRYNDFKKLTRENIMGGTIYQDTSKTGRRVELPLHWIAKEIIAKHGGNLPKPISDVKMNQYIKEVGREVGLNQVEQKSRTEGGRRVIRKYKKWELMTTHTARRSFATNLYLEGIPIQIIMAFTGHITESEFFKYIKITGKEAALNLTEHSFFKK